MVLAVGQYISQNKIAKQKEEYQSVIDKLKNLQDKEDGDTVNTIIEEYLRR